MVTPKNLGLGLVLTALGSATLPTQGFADNFHYTQEESEIFNTDFDSSFHWFLNGTVIDSGTINF